MADAVEKNVISLLSQDDALPGQLDLEPAADQYDRCRPPLFSDPFRAPLAAGMNRPSDLYVLGAADITGGHEAAKYPSPAFFTIYLGVPGIDQICHGG
jgi:hypothetical protein